MNPNHHVTLIEALLDIVDFRTDRQTEGGNFPKGTLPPGPLDPAFFVPPKVTDGQVTEKELFRWLKDVLAEFAAEELCATGFTSLRRLYYNHPSAQERAREALPSVWLEPPPSFDEGLFLLGAGVGENALGVPADTSPAPVWDHGSDETEGDEEIEYNVPRFTWPKEK